MPAVVDFLYLRIVQLRQSVLVDLFRPRFPTAPDLDLWRLRLPVRLEGCRM
jgi:hypothetical protein